MLRIISGRAKGYRLYSVPGKKPARPTSDRVKEALFNLLPDPEGCSLIDLYAGTGNVGLEALSRGARRVCFVESDPAMIDVIRRNIEKCGFDDGCEILRMPVDRAVDQLTRRGERFDIVFADPPYDLGFMKAILRRLENGALLKTDGVMVLQHSPREEVPQRMEALERVDQRKYGDTLLSIFKRTSNGDGLLTASKE